MTARLLGIPKPTTYRNQRIRDSAKDKFCLMELPGCRGAAIWSHYRGSNGGKGMGLKADDLAGCYACTNCDAVYDGQRPRPAGFTQADVELAWHEAHIRSIVILHAEGVIK